MNQQLAFRPPINNSARFENFFWQNNTVLRDTLLASLSFAPQAERVFYLWGETGSGKSHLLQASCQLDLTPCAYLPLRQLVDMGPEILDNLEELNLIAIDDLEKISGNAAWEEALFHFYNKVLAQEKTRLLFTADKPIAALNIQLPDLLSRLSASLIFHVASLAETDCIALLEERAHERGLVLPLEVMHFLIRRFPRNPGQLLEIFEKLDEAAWKEQHRITVPFVKKTLAL